jgi:Ser/Thr protein kinase RdoA (MazF antagonist)
VQLDQVLAEWGFVGARVSPISIGLINRTFLVERGEQRFVLQRLHPIFSPEVNLDIDAITAHLARGGVVTPRPVPTLRGALSTDAPDGTWRMLTYVEGRTIEQVSSPSIAREAGRAAGRFHRTLAGFDHEFRFTRPGVHDTPKHLARLHDALDEHARHVAIEEVRPVAQAILEHGASLPAIADVPRRIVHGDLKISNVLFDEGLTRALALVDLDTMAHGTFAVDLGDALRSWCNPAGEDEPEATADPALYEAAMEGWLVEARDVVTPAELEAIPRGVETIALELAARFCADALEDRYFGWDEARFSSRTEHNLVRARSQLSVARSVRDQKWKTIPI